MVGIANPDQRGSSWYSNVDDLSVLCTSYSENNWIFSTIQNPSDGQHPVSGNRQFGIKQVNDKYYFYTRGADRLTGVLDATLGDPMAFNKADKLWRSVMNKLNIFINSNGGQSNFDPSKIKWNQYTW